MSDLREVIASYLPRIVLERYITGEIDYSSIPDCPDRDHVLTEDDKRHMSTDRFPASILFVDISGFTSLNEKFAKEGSKGIEKVITHINGYFTQLIDMIAAHGGDVLKTAGDALIVSFGDAKQSGTLREYVLQATACGLEIQKELRSYDADGISLTLHIAVGAGEIFMFHLGGISEHWEFFPAGSLFGQISDALDKSQSGQTFLSAHAHSLVADDVKSLHVDGDYLVVSLLKPIARSPWEPLPIATAPDTFLKDIRGYIGDGVLKRIDAGQAQWLAEMRTVSVLFVSLKGLSFQNNEAATPAPADASASVSNASSAPIRVKKVVSPEVVPQGSTPRVMTSGGGLVSDSRPAVARDHAEIVPDFNELNMVLRVMQRVVFRNEGFVRQFLVDDKGCTLIAVFGAPVSHHDDPVRAVYAALAIKNQLKALGLRSYMGVTTGTAFCGTVGSPTRQEYAVVGDIVNLSARLMVASYKGQHGILCDAATNGIAGKKFNMAALDPITVKGKSEPIPIFIPTRPVTDRMSTRFNHERKHSSALNLIDILQGRNSEKFLLVGHLENLSNGRSFAVVCNGIAGIGKTRLAQELMAMAKVKLGENSVVVGGGDSIEKFTPFLVFSFVLQQIYDLTDDTKANENAIRTAISKISDFDRRNELFGHMALLNDLIATDFPQSATVNKLSGTAYEQERIDAIRKLLYGLLQVAAAENPLVIVLEDAQWLNPHSWTLINDIITHSHSILLFVGSRIIPTDLQSPQFISFSNSPSAHFVHLTPLEPKDILQIIRQTYSLVGEDALPPALSTIITDKAQGNPFFAKEIVKSLVAKGVVEKSEGQLTMKTGLEQVTVPDNLKSLILSNFDQLKAFPQLVLKVASVIGKVIDVDVIQAVFPSEAKGGDIVTELQSLMKDGVVSENIQTLKKNTYLFSSNLFQSVAYNMMLEGQRKELHLAIAAYYERVFEETDSLGPIFNVLSHHLKRGEKFAKAEYYAERLQAREKWRLAYRLVAAAHFWGSKALGEDEVDASVVLVEGEGEGDGEGAGEEEGEGEGEKVDEEESVSPSGGEKGDF